MTEKRFIVSDKWIKDNCIGKLLNIDFNTITGANLCCELLNQIETEKRNNGKLASKLLDENEQLRIQVSEQGTQIDFLKDENKHMRKVLEENKELKQYLKQIQDSLWTTEHIKKLEKENEQLRKEKIDAETKLYKANEELLMMNDYDFLCKENTELEKENEQLKQFIKELTTKRTGRIELPSGYSYNVSAVLTGYKGDVE